EDVVHDVFISFLKVVDRFELRRSLAGYLKTSVANRARDYRSRRRPQPFAAPDDEEMQADDRGPVQSAIRRELSQKLGLALSGLPYEQREAVVMRLHGQMKFKAIAELQKVSTKTAHVRYRAGLDGLKSMLNGEFEK
ncbi:MAG: RNA polymerase sigma factor, partial [Planctomycetota bacterium]